MITAVDSSVLLDVLLDDPRHAYNSRVALRRASAEGSLILCESVLAEVAPTLTSEEVGSFMRDWNLAFVPSTQQSALQAGEMFRRYLERGGRRGRIVAEFSYCRPRSTCRPTLARPGPWVFSRLL